MRRVTDRRSTGVLPTNSAEEKPDRWVMWIFRGFAAYVIDGIPLFRPAPYLRLRTFTYSDSGHLYEKPGTSPRP